MVYSGYQYRDARWKHRSHDLLMKASFKCEDCGTNYDTSAYVNYWDKEKDLWDFDSKYIKCLCKHDRCLRWKVMDKIQRYLALLSGRELNEIAGIIEFISNIEERREPSISALRTFILRDGFHVDSTTK